MSPVADLTAHTGYWLRLLSNAVSQDFARKLAAEGVTVAEWCVLRVLYDGDGPDEGHGLAPSALADRLGLTRGAVSKLADRLLAKGLVLRVADPQDGRAHRLYLSPAGRARVPVLAAIADRNDADYFGALTPAEHDRLLRMLKGLAARRGLKQVPLD